MGSNYHLLAQPKTQPRPSSPTCISPNSSSPSCPSSLTAPPSNPRSPPPNSKKQSPHDFADPSLILVSNTWCTFATNLPTHSIHVQTARSIDFTIWTLLPNDALPTLPPWANATHPQIWAPHVTALPSGAFVLYFSARVAGHPHHCVGAATSRAVLGPYTPLPTPLACPLRAGGAIDASAFLDPADGARYLLYKVDGNSIGHGGLCGNTAAPVVPTPIMLQRVAPDGTTVAGGAAVRIFDREKQDGPLVEAPSLMRAADGMYVLFFSSSCFSSAGYNVDYAVADSVAGPYVRAARPLIVSGMGGLMAPGGATVAVDGRHLVFHAGGVGAREMYSAVVKVDAGTGVVLMV